MNQKKKEPGKKSTRASMRERRLLQQIAGQDKFDAHGERVKERDNEYKVITGELRGSGEIRSSLRYTSTGAIRGSLEAITREENILTLQYIQDRNRINASVKARIKNMKEVKIYKFKKNWTEKGAVRTNIRDFSKYCLYRSEISQYNKTFKEYPQPIVGRLEEGQEHPKRSVACSICSHPMDSVNMDFYVIQGSCFHTNCIKEL